MVVLVSMLLLAAAAPGAERRGQRVSVSIMGQRFTPPTVTISTGDSVVWVNRDDRDHSIEADDGSFASGKIKSGGAYACRFDETGTYPYSCSLHPREKGRVIVRTPAGR